MRRRHFLERLGQAGGAGAVYQAMSAMGLLAPPDQHPFRISGRGNGERILILGAGVGGLAAAYELGKLGYDCQVLEARDRPGGRCHTYRRGTTIVETDGMRQTVGFDEGLYFNPGPTRIPADHVSTLNYCRELGVPVEVFCNVNDYAYYHGQPPGPPRAPRDPTSDGATALKITHREAKADMFGYTHELMAKAIRRGALDEDLTQDDREALLGFLRADGWLNERFDYGPSERRGYAVPQGAGAASGELSQPLDRSLILRSGVGYAFTYEEYHFFNMTMLQVVGGTDRLAVALADRLAPRIEYGAEVREIRHQEAGVRVAYRDRAGAIREATADYCICNIPLPVLRGIASDLSPAMQGAIASVDYIHVGKIALQMKRRFWEEDDRIFGGVTLTTLPIEQILYPSTGYLSSKGVLVGSYHYEKNSDYFGAMQPDERVREALTLGRQIHPQYDAEFETGASVVWQKTPYTLGGWAEYTEATRRDSYPVLIEPDRRIYLCGEHCSYLTSWMAGAFESAHLVVRQIHERASQTH